MSRERQDDFQGDVATLVAKPQLKQPPKYKVIMLNDDFTPMDFVVEVLLQFFYLSLEQAEKIMLQVHQEGQAVCGIFSRDVAETKAALVIDFAREHEHPLRCSVEVADE